MSSSINPLRALLCAPARTNLTLRTPTLPLSYRLISTTPFPRLPYKNDQDRESVKPRAHEYTGSGSDDGAAAQEDAAFNPDKTSPEEAKKTAGKGQAEGDSNPLEVSPANKDVSEAGRGKEEDRPHTGSNQKPSGGGNQQKKGKVN